RLVEILDRVIDSTLPEIGNTSYVESRREFGIEPERFIVVVDGAFVIPVAQVDVAPVSEGGDQPLRALPAGLDHGGTARELLLRRNSFSCKASAGLIGFLGDRGPRHHGAGPPPRLPPPRAAPNPPPRLPPTIYNSPPNSLD